jgi:endonuclease YncB( thermonuclease family)
MAGWAARRRTGHRDARPLILVVLLVGSIAIYAYQRRHPPTLTTVVGTSHVIDGDTIDIRSTRIRLEAIDAPELDQACTDPQGRSWPCGSAAARELRQHVSGQELRCEPSRFDQYKRVLAICFLADGVDVNAWMVRQGWALAFRSTTRYRAEQAEAAAAKRGLWAGTFMPPWEWRQHETRRTGAASTVD